MPLAALNRLLIDLFISNDALLLFLSEFARELLPSCPDHTISRDIFAFRIVELLRARRYLDMEFFARLGQGPGSRRVDEVIVVASGLLDREAVERLRQILPRSTGPGGAAPRERLKVLILAADPKGLDSLALNKEIAIIEEALGRPGVAERVQVRNATAVTADVFADQLLEYRPDVLHFAGHGNAKGEPQLLDADTATAQAASLAAVRQLFRKARQLRCIVFNACYSARIGQELALEIPVVIGMRGGIDDASSLTFARHFYTSLARACSLQDAFDVARAVIAAKGLFGADLPQMNFHADSDPGTIVLLP